MARDALTVESSEPAAVVSKPRARILAMGGGKGGVGKSFLTANLAHCFARSGHRAVAVDADLEGANLHTCLGVPSPRTGLADFVAGRQDDLRKLLVETSLSNLQLIGGTHANLHQPQPGHSRRVEFLRGLRALDTDFVLIDLGAGTQAATLDYFLVADMGLLVLHPEPTSVENAYAFLRAAFYRRLRLAVLGHDVRSLIREVVDQRNERGVRNPQDLLREIERIDPVEGRRVAQTMQKFKPRIVINDVKREEDVTLGFEVASVCRKYFGFEAEYLGYVNHDEAVRQSVNLGRPLVDYLEDSEASSYLRRIARKIVGSLAETGLPGAQS
ncbi:MAG: P-loop NTPase [Myxococcota bacterium]